MKKSVFNIFEKNKKNTREHTSRTQAKKIVLNAASYSDFQYRQSNTPPVSRVRQIPEKREIVRTSRVSKSRLAIIGSVIVAAVAIPVFFATAANSNEVAKIAEINLSSPSPSANLQAAVAATPKSESTGGELTGDLTETLTQATPVAAAVNVEPAAAQADPNASVPASPEVPAASPVEQASTASASPEALASSVFLTFKQGDNDPFVGMIQQRLMDLYYMESDETTTLFGPTTSEAIGFFQRKNSLPVDGSAGPATLELLFSNNALRYTVSEGDDGPDVESIQDRLDELGYDVSTTSYFGSDTKKAVIAFQKRNNITDDGSIGAETKELLYSSKAKGPKSSGSSSSSSGKTGNSTHIANPGSVEAFIQAAMNQLGVPYRLGGKSSSSLDCSGLVYYALKLSGNGIGYMTSGGWAGADQYARISSMSALQRGDIVCVSGHVGIYLGGGQVINASSSNGKVIISNNIFASNYWTSNWICGRRPL